MLEIFNSTLNQVLMMFIFMLIGYFINKKGIGGEGVGRVLSALEVNIFLPAMCFQTFAGNFTVSAISENIIYLYAGTAVIVASFFVAKLLSKLFAENELQRDIYMYSFLIPNIGYMGYPLIEAVFGAEALFKMMIFVIPFNIVIYTYGLYILNPRRQWGLKLLMSPTMIGLILGMICGLLQVQLPGVITNVVVSAKNCMSPTAMLLTGFILASIPIKPVLVNFKSYVAALIRGIVIPALAFAVMYLIKIDTFVMIIAVATLAMPMGLNSIVFPEAFGGDSVTGAKTCFVSNLVSLVTIPLVFAFLGNFV